MVSSMKNRVVVPMRTARTNDFATRPVSASRVPSAGWTASAASTEKPPANTPSRANNAASAADSRSWLHASAAPSARWWGGAAALAPKFSSPKRFRRRRTIWAGVSTGVRAAASSIASGSPSSAAHSIATARASSSSAGLPCSAARSRNSRTES
jgi:hypothetical protein